MERVGEHAVPVGPLAVRWLAYELDEPRAGVEGRARVRLENAGSAAWRSRGQEGVQLAYHWLDPLGNPIVWDGVRAPLPRVIEPGEEVELDVTVVAPRPQGSYRLAFDLVEEFRFWFEEVGSTPLDIPVEVQPRIAERRLQVVLHGAVAIRSRTQLWPRRRSRSFRRTRLRSRTSSQGPSRRSDWSRLLLDAHEEGYAAVGPALEVSRGERRRFAPWAPGGGRNPRFTEPLLLPSLLEGFGPAGHEGLPSFSGADALFEGRAVVRLRPRSGRPSG